jgi:hypothetical protein
MINTLISRLALEAALYEGTKHRKAISLRQVFFRLLSYY